MSIPSNSATLTLAGALVLVGAGKMGDALLRGWLGRGLSPQQIVIFEPAPSTELLALAGAQAIRLNPQIVDVTDASVLVLAVKPQAMQDVLPGLAPLAKGGALILSIAAGKPIGFFEQYFSASPIVRAMPNTPAAIGLGMTVLCANGRVTDAQREMAYRLMDAVGEVAWIQDETLMDPVTAVSGSGPAYVFLLIEALASAGEKAGLDAGLANLLARQTVRGAAALAAQSDQPASLLRENVTSPGGTTAAALAVLMRPEGLQMLLDEAVEAATRRSRELAQ
ncbi:MAG: pyrroline-5-carboxylate reductase [Alphaproteobacteria bacterium]